MKVVQHFKFYNSHAGQFLRNSYRFRNIADGSSELKRPRLATTKKKFDFIPLKIFYGKFVLVIMTKWLLK